MSIKNRQRPEINLFSILMTLVILLGSSSFLKAIPVPDGLFSDHAILQRGKIVPVWGTGRNDEKIRVELNGQSVKTITIGSKWMVNLKPMEAGGPYTLQITGDTVITIKDVYIGEVWLCSGQSNMAFRVGNNTTFNGQEEIASANYPLIRQYYVPNKASQVPVVTTQGKWQMCTPQTVKSFTAVGYFFARELYAKLHVPFGIIFSAVGGTAAECWTSRETLEQNPKLKNIVDDFDKTTLTYPDRLARYKQEEPMLLEKYQRALEISRQDSTKPKPKIPAPPQDPVLAGGAGGLYAGMIRPLQPFAIKGVIWYQGEANSTRPEQYKTLFPTLIASWRKDWNIGNFPFLFVQVAPWKGTGPEVREAQLLTWLSTPATAMAVTMDCGNAENIHPPQKQPVGLRLALAARAIAYHEDIEYSGPLYQSIKMDGSNAILSFTHQKNLVAKGGNLRGFQIAGADKKFVDAIAEIKGNQIVVYSPEVSSPVSVRYGWAFVPDGNFYNQDDLPASPFRTEIGN